MGKRVYVETSILIDAEIGKVWDIMNDFSSYSAWNPFIRRVELRERGGKRLMKFFLEWHDGAKGSSLEEMISAKKLGEDGFELRYKYASRLAKIGLIRAERIQTVIEKKGMVKYYTIEEYTGPLKGLIPVRRVRVGFERQAQALKAAAEVPR
jgi:hypothetical protein